MEDQSVPGVDSGSWALMCGKMEVMLKEFPDNFFDAVVTDPPYGLKFMGKKWDYQVPTVEQWSEILRVLKPGGYLLSFGGSRTFHRVTVNIEDAGFEIRDTIMWLYGSGFPKSLNIKGGEFTGWGTALKPAYEPIVMARKPLDGTVVQNFDQWGVGGINIDGCRVSTDDVIPETTNQNIKSNAYKSDNSDRERDTVYKQHDAGRWPANVIHDGSEEVLAGFPETKSGKPGTRRKVHETNAMAGRLNMTGEVETGYGDEGSAARFFYCAKATKADRDEGNDHPTVKPTPLMRYLVKLVTPKKGFILDPFCGSGSTGKAAMLEGFGFVGIDQDEACIATSTQRIESVS